MGWYGSDLIRDLQDPYRKDRNPSDNFTKNYFGYFDIWGLKDAGVDVLGTGPAIVTNGPPGAGKSGFQRSDDPPFQEMRGRLNIRHNQRFLPEDEDHLFEELRLQLEVAYASDRNFIEEYYKRLFDTGMDQETLAYRHLAERQPVCQPLDRGQPSELVHRHPMAPTCRLLPPGRLALLETCLIITRIQVWIMQQSIPTLW